MPTSTSFPGQNGALTSQAPHRPRAIFHDDDDPNVPPPPDPTPRAHNFPTRVPGLVRQLASIRRSSVVSSTPDTQSTIPHLTDHQLPDHHRIVPRRNGQSSNVDRVANPYHFTNSSYPDQDFHVDYDDNARYPPGEYPEGAYPGVRYDEDEDEWSSGEDTLFTFFSDDGAEDDEDDEDGEGDALGAIAIEDGVSDAGSGIEVDVEEEIEEETEELMEVGGGRSAPNGHVSPQVATLATELNAIQEPSNNGSSLSSNAASEGDLPTAVSDGQLSSPPTVDAVPGRPRHEAIDSSVPTPPQQRESNTFVAFGNPHHFGRPRQRLYPNGFNQTTAHGRGALRSLLPPLDPFTEGPTAPQSRRDLHRQLRHLRQLERSYIFRSGQLRPPQRLPPIGSIYRDPRRREEGAPPPRVVLGTRTLRNRIPHSSLSRVDTSRPSVDSTLANGTRNLIRTHHETLGSIPASTPRLGRIQTEPNSRARNAWLDSDSDDYCTPDESWPSRQVRPRPRPLGDEEVLWNTYRNQTRDRVRDVGVNTDEQGIRPIRGPSRRLNTLLWVLIGLGTAQTAFLLGAFGGVPSGWVSSMDCQLHRQMNILFLG